MEKKQNTQWSRYKNGVDKWKRKRKCVQKKKLTGTRKIDSRKRKMDPSFYSTNNTML